MPIYEYHCGKCQQDFELLIRNREQPECPTCRSRNLEKQISVTAAPIASQRLPLCPPAPSGGCGLPPCGSGGCMME